MLLGRRRIARLGWAASGVSVPGAFVTGSVVTALLQGGVAGTPGRVELQAYCDDGTSEAAAILLPVTALLTLTQGDPMPIDLQANTAGTTQAAVPVPVFAPSASSVTLTGQVMARNPATGDTAVWDVRAVIKAWASPAASVASQSVTPSQLDAALAAAVVMVAVSGSTLTLLLTGVAGDALTWSANVTWVAA